MSRATFDDVMDGVAPDPKVIESMESQPEFKTPIWDYLAFLVDEQRVNDGRQMMNRHGAALAAAERRYGVDRYAIAAVRGVESDFGQLAGKWYLPQALATLACTGPRRQDYFRGELIAPLQLVQRGDLTPQELRGSDGPSGRTAKRPPTEWAALGARRMDGSMPTGPGPAALLLPAGPTGSAFLVFRNYDAIYSYNAAESYALAIALLSDRLRGQGGVQTPWPTTDRGLSRAERKGVQELLLKRGHDIGEVDGALGARTRQAVRQYQQRIGTTPDGRAGGYVLDSLRRGR